jgi:hypothetical protein
VGNQFPVPGQVLTCFNSIGDARCTQHFVSRNRAGQDLKRSFQRSDGGRGGSATSTDAIGPQLSPLLGHFHKPQSSYQVLPPLVATVHVMALTSSAKCAARKPKAFSTTVSLTGFKQVSDCLQWQFPSPRCGLCHSKPLRCWDTRQRLATCSWVHGGFMVHKTDLQF